MHFLAVICAFVLACTQVHSLPVSTNTEISLPIAPNAALVQRRQAVGMLEPVQEDEPAQEVFDLADRLSEDLDAQSKEAQKFVKAIESGPEALKKAAKAYESRVEFMFTYVQKYWSQDHLARTVTDFLNNPVIGHDEEANAEYVAHFVGEKTGDQVIPLVSMPYHAVVPLEQTASEISSNVIAEVDRDIAQSAEDGAEALVRAAENIMEHA